jgi:hypothetical protein
MDALYHAQACAKKWGGNAEEYLPINLWFDESSKHINDARHRALRHHSFGIAECVERFGRILTLSSGKNVPVKQIGELHIVADLGFVPTVSDWVRSMRTEPWMASKRTRRRVLQ